jgi:Fe-Mn family superoxide dismutase
MGLNSQETKKIHVELFEGYKQRLELLEKGSDDDEEQEEPFERSFLHNAIYLHRLWFEQLEGRSEEMKSSPLLDEILERRDSDLSTFKTWMNEFAQAASPGGWAVWGWAHSLKTFVGFPIRSHDEAVPLGVTPLLVIDCWEHACIMDFGLDFDSYLDMVWAEMNWEAIEQRHQELAGMFGYGVK